MLAKYSDGKGKLFFDCFFSLFFDQILAWFWVKVWDKTFFCVGQPSCVLKKANLVSMSKATTENDINVSINIVAATFENEFDFKEVLGEEAVLLFWCSKICPGNGEGKLPRKHHILLQLFDSQKKYIILIYLSLVRL